MVAVPTVRRRTHAGEGGKFMMLRFQWDSLRRGDHIVVHDAARADLKLRSADVVLLDTRGPDTTSPCYNDGPDAGRVVRPGRFAVHADPLDDIGCWRCDEYAAAA